MKILLEGFKLFKKYWKIILVIILLIVVGGGVYYQFFRQPSGNKSQTINPNNIYTVKKGNMTKTIDGEGYIKPVNEENLSFPSTSGGTKITDINVDEGDIVEKGDVLVELDKREAKLNYLQNKNALKKSKISGSKNEIEEAKLNLQIAKDRIDNLTLKAPFSGLISDVYIEEGNYYENGNAITIKNTNKLKSEINIEESNFKEVKLGQKAEIELDSIPTTVFTGKVTEIANEADNSGGTVTLPVTVTLDKTNKDIKINSSARVEIITNEIKDVLMVPITAVISKNNKEMIKKVVKENETKTVEVKTGLTNGLKIEIKSGLKEGDKILLNTFRQSDSLESGSNFGPGRRSSGGGPSR